MQATGTIGDLKQDVIDALQGRTDISDSLIVNYVARSLVEITESYPFHELQTTGPNFNLTNGQSTYPITNFLNVGDDYSMPESMVIYIDVGTNQVTTQVKYKTPAGIETLTAPAVQGIPAWYTRFDTNFLFGPVPNASYTVFLRYQVKHPFNGTPTLSTPIYITKSWYDIVAYSAAARIAVVKRWADQRKELHDLLYGDPEFTMSQGKRGRPGLIAARVFQPERDQMYNSRSIGVTVGRYNAR